MILTDSTRIDKRKKRYCFTNCAFLRKFRAKSFPVRIVRFAWMGAGGA
jgi:hypothetical protein